VQVTIKRIWFTDQSTQGELYIDDEFAFYTLELPNKDGKPGSCIPQGTYKIEIWPSKKFGREMPLITGIPGRSEIEIHWGNTPENTEGCVLLGLSQASNFIGDSRLAFDAFWDKTEAAIRAGDCTLTVQGGAMVQPAELNLQGDA
jgi:Steigviridae/Suoliviridae L,D-carboxypeptidase/transpeptidase